MLLNTCDAAPKGWYLGPWNSELPFPVGYANQGIDEPHVHHEVFEIYLVARGTSVIRIDDRDLELTPGMCLVVEPGEAHTFLESSPDYLHFVLQVPPAGQEFTGRDKQLVPRERLGL